MNPQAGPIFTVLADYEEVSRRAAAEIEQEVRNRPDILLCAAAGSSPRRAYQMLGETASREPAIFESLRVIKVDEWGGLPEGASATCEEDLRRNLLLPLKIGPDRYQGFASDPADPHAECRRVSEWLERSGSIDLCILGLGTNGHIAMNEPAEKLHPKAHIAQLAESSLKHSMLRSSAQVPTYGLTLGMREILNSKRILLMVSGEAKRGVLSKLRNPVVTTRFPASFLWLHSNVTVLHDRAAGSN